MALGAGAEVIGINNRDLTTLEVDIERTFELIPRIPDGKVIVAESGFAPAASSSASRRPASMRC